MSLSGQAAIFGIDPYSVTSTPLHDLGTKGYSNDGRIYRYGQAAGTEIAAGKLCISPAITANHEDIAFAAAAVIGAKTVTLTLGATAITGNEYEGGTLLIVDDTGEGYSHEITSAPATDANGTATITIKPGLQVAVTTSTTATLVRNPYRDVVIAVGGTQTSIPVGVSPRVMTADYYGWFQTGGWATVLQSGTNTPTAGEPVTIGEATNGSVSGRDSVAEPVVGIAQETTNPVSGEHNGVFLQIDN